MAINDPEGYVLFTKVTINGTRVYFSEYKNIFTWDTQETILDVGCGTGHVTSNVIMDFIPSDANVVSIDISDKMINYAKNNFKSPRISYKVFDITADNIFNVWDKEQFNKVFCLYTLHLIKEDRKALQNMYNLLKPGGQIFALFVINRTTDKINPYLAKLPKYHKYAEAISQMTFHVGLREDHESYTEQSLKDIGFQEISIIIKNTKVVLESVDGFVESCRVAPHLGNILPKDLFQDALIDIRKILIEHNILEKAEGGGYYLRNTVLGFTARKPK